MQTEQLPPPRAQAAPPNLAPEAPARDGTRIPTLSAAGWLAATGAALLLAASVVVVAGQWQAITPEIRFAGLIAALLAVYFVAEAGRPRYPSTSTALATLAATMTAPVGVAAAATLDQPWPVCIVTGGLAALVAAEVQSRRWSVTVLKAATIAAVGLAASGVAAMTGTPVALWVAGAAVVALAADAWRRSVVLGVAVGCSPVLLALSDAGIGPGTLARMGATGPSLRWSAPLAAVVAAAVIGIAAHRRSELALVALAAATFTSGLLVGVAHRDVGAIAWWSLPALVLLVVEAVAVVGRRSVWGSAAEASAPWVVAPLALGGLAAPLLAAVGRAVADWENRPTDHGWALPLGLTACALAVAAAGSVRRTGRPWQLATTFAAASGAALGAVMMTGPQIFSWPEVATLAVIAGAAVVVGRSVGPAWLHAAAALAVVDVAAALGVAGLDADHAACALMALAATLTGIGFLRASFTPIDTAALTAGGLLVLVWRPASPVVTSLIGITISGQLLMYSIAQRRWQRAAVAGAAFGASTVSLWWTTGANDVFLGLVERYGADGADVALGIATIVLLVFGALLRRLQPVSSWLAYSPGLGMAAAWLLDAQFDAQTAWATFGALGIGVVATGVGGFRRLGAPLVIGTAMIAGTMLISAGPRLAAAPTWSWIAAGGIGLLVLAAAVERSSRPLTGRNGDELSLVEQFRQDFD